MSIKHCEKSVGSRLVHPVQHKVLRVERAQQGYILIAAVLVMLILAGIALTLTKLSISQNSVVDQALLRARTELALESAAHWITTATILQDDCIVSVVDNIYFDETGANVPNGPLGYLGRFTCDPNAAMEFDENGTDVRRFNVVLQTEYNERTNNPDDPANPGQRAMVVRRSVMEFSL